MLTGASTPASRRHVHLVKSAPAAHDTLAVAPKSISLWFSEGVELKVTTVKVTDAAGKVTPTSAPALRDAEKDAPVVASLSKTLAPGGYAIAWSTSSRDGHPARGTINFVVLGPR